jgi:chromosome segregation ATPase
MRPADYSEEQIIEAGKALQEAGKRVTPFGIREHMGGGKPQRIRTVWDSYLAGNLEQEARQEEAVELPAEFAEQVQGMNTALIADLTAFAKRVYKRADEIAESRTREAMLAAKQAKEGAETDVADAERMLGDQDAKVEALEQQLGALQEQLAGAQRELRELEQEKAKEITALSVENSRLGEQVNTAQSQAQAAEKALDTAVTEREREQMAHEQERGRWEKDSEALRALLQKIQTKAPPKSASPGKRTRT